VLPSLACLDRALGRTQPRSIDGFRGYGTPDRAVKPVATESPPCGAG